MTYSIVPTRVLHVKQIAALMCDAACMTIQDAGHDPRRTVHRAFVSSHYCRTALIDNRPVAMWGMSGNLLSDHAMVWLVLSDEAAKLPLAVVKCARRELEIMHDMGGTLYATIGRDDEPAAIFARTLGFRPTHDASAPEGLTAYAFVGRPYRQCAVLRDADAAAPPFIIHGLGRSRTAWLAEFLTYGRWQCLHEQAIYLRRPEELSALFSRPRTGYCETAASFGWPLIVHARPDVVQVVIDRDPADAERAMIEHYNRVGLGFDPDTLSRVFERGAKVLRRISALPNVLTIPYEALETEDGCRRIFEACLPYVWDRGWWLKMRGRRVESNLAGIVAYYQNNQEGVEGFKRLCGRELTRLMRAGELPFRQ